MELLAPVADKEMLLAAVHNGADAVYIGMPKFNARAKNTEFSFEILKEYIDYCHLYGVKVYVAFNVLIFESELEELYPLVVKLIGIYPDAIIVQDLGLAGLIKAICPQQEIHASTQMTITSKEAIEATVGLGIKRYILARELSFDNIKAIKSRTDKELEVFAHGSLCISYSGQCLASGMLFGKSGNRGQCKQLCRMKYDLICQNGTRSQQIISKSPLLSPDDLCAAQWVEKLKAVGVSSLKLEGRYKSAEYVAQVVRTYRALIDGKVGVEKLNDFTDKLSIIYSRGFSDGWLNGLNPKKTVQGKTTDHHGLHIGTVKKISGKQIFISADKQHQALLQKGVGLCFIDKNTYSKAGGNVYAVKVKAGLVCVDLKSDFNVSVVKPGTAVFINSVPSLEKELRHSFTDKDKLKRIPIRAKVTGRIGTPLSLEVFDNSGNTVFVQSDCILERARHSPTQPGEHTGSPLQNTENFVRADPCVRPLEQELLSLGGSCFSLAKDDIEFDLRNEVFVNQREIRKLRQAAVQKLEQARMGGNLARNCALPAKLCTFDTVRDITAQNITTRPVEFNYLIKSLPALCNFQQTHFRSYAPNVIYLDLPDFKDWQEALSVIEACGARPGVATLQISKPGEFKILEKMLEFSPARILVRNVGALNFLLKETSGANVELVGDYTLNVTNSLSAAWLMEQGIKYFSPSYDLDLSTACYGGQEAEAGNFMKLFQKIGFGRCEYILSNYVPMFHCEFCLYAGYLGKGGYRNCGRLCKQCSLLLRSNENEMSVKADMCCRNTIYLHKKDEKITNKIENLLPLGIRIFRFEAL